ncbi:uncharacterized protein LOC114580414 [Dendrobium catenatum]|uniref:uncharacterized protein LOC114580414 n=1 Tax=Dendrobium catenatum TaxID=906689 RepID=UPI0010A03B36|nr:uncharacterized protein LOC114580414 [Dendrobium catenatum]
MLCSWRLEEKLRHHSGIRARMAEGSNRVAACEERSLDGLWAEHNNLVRRTEEISADMHHLFGELGRELRLINARLDRNQAARTPGPVNLPATRRGFVAGRDCQRNTRVLESTDSEEEINLGRSVEQSDSEGEIIPNRRRRQTDRDRTHGDFRIKLDIPFFDGGLHIEDYLDWERSVESFFEYMEVEPERQVKYVACRLRGGMSAWWQQVVQSRRREGRGAVRSWYQHCSQGSKTVNEYTEEFYQLSARNNLQESENQLVARYIGGLKESIQERLELNSVWSLSQAVNYALKIEIQSKRHTQNRPNRRNWNPPAEANRNATPHPTQISKPMPSSVSSGQPATPGQKQFERGNLKGKAPMKENPYAKPGNFKCFCCFQPGHKSNECPTRAQLQLLEGEMMKKKGKVCDVLIDSGCTENVVSRGVVQSLQLKNTKSPNPYRISWVKKGIEMLVTNMCKVPFSIGKHYASEVLCDVIDMDVCHLILGRPWQYDVGAIFDGRANTYSFEWKGKRLRLLPRVPDQDANNVNSKASLVAVSGKSLLNEWKDSSCIMALLVKEQTSSPEAHSLPEAVKSLLQQFADVAPPELPVGLPPLRAIQHQIELVPGANLPNLPHYKLSSNEHNVLQQIVDEMLDKQLIQPSLNSCAVPALLVPKKDGSWRICMDSRSINKITVKFRFPMPRMEDMLDNLSGAQVFSKLDLRISPNQSATW